MVAKHDVRPASLLSPEWSHMYVCVYCIMKLVSPSILCEKVTRSVFWRAVGRAGDGSAPAASSASTTLRGASIRHALRLG